MKAFFDKLGKNKFYVMIFKNPFTYIAGAILLSIFQVVTLSVTGDPWGVSGTFANWGAWLYRLVGGNVDKWYYFSGAGAQATLDNGILNDPGTMRNIGIVLGALAATLLASQFKIKKIKSIRQVVAAVLGGLLMGYGARIAFGCNIGALYSGIASMSLSGWVFAIFLFLGAFVGSKLLAKFFM
ncbi:MAG: YeeE/YedE thiosulfate transporter family protein [Candidatus Limiplasma sp.]|nr:YeeE/YedE thiosulfate transporter family protein [Candidatus Limiplasma sp.]